MEYEDGAMTLFLYTKGTQENNEELEQLLHYMEDTREANVVNADLADIYRMVKAVKKDAEVSIAYMRFMEDVERAMAQEFKQERKQILKQGLEQGLERGRIEGADFMKKAFKLISKGYNTVDKLVAEGIPGDIALSALTED